MAAQNKLMDTVYALLLGGALMVFFNDVVGVPKTPVVPDLPQPAPQHMVKASPLKP